MIGVRSSDLADMTAAPDRGSGASSATLARDIEREIGLSFAAGDARLQSALASRGGSGLAPTAPQWDAFVEDLLVHETYFFRHPRQFEAIEQTVLPKLRDRARQEQRGSIAMWSASCSTGEEIWTMALIADAVMTAAEVGFRIYGSDLSAAVLETARRAVYRRSPSLGSFRNLSAAQLARFPGLDGGAESWSPPAHLQRAVELFRHNLLEPAPIAPLDLILCRNTLIYMGVEARRRVIGRFAALLRPGGYLALGPAETPEGDPRFIPADPEDVLLFRRVPDDDMAEIGPS
jgi:chemotaxis protein methyltransferase CheR